MNHSASLLYVNATVFNVLEYEHCVGIIHLSLSSMGMIGEFAVAVKYLLFLIYFLYHTLVIIEIQLALQDVCPYELVFAPHFLHIVIEIKFSMPPHI